MQSKLKTTDFLEYLIGIQLQYSVHKIGLAIFSAYSGGSRCGVTTLEFNENCITKT